MSDETKREPYEQLLDAIKSAPADAGRFGLCGDHGAWVGDCADCVVAMRAQALEQAIRANLGRAHHVARIDGDHVTDLVRDADGETLAAVTQEWSGYVVSYGVYQHAEPSFIMA